MRTSVITICVLILICALPLWPVARAEMSITTNEYFPVYLNAPPGVYGDYTANYGNLSTVPRAEDGFSEAITALNVTAKGGIYVGAYESEWLFEFDYEPPPPAEGYAGMFSAGQSPNIYATYRALDAGLDYARFYASIGTNIKLPASAIAEGSSSCIVRIPVPASGIIPETPETGGGPAFLQITRVIDGESYIIISGRPTIEAGLAYQNTVEIDDRQYMHVTAPLIADELYEFKYFWCLQGLVPDSGNESETIRPLVYFSNEDILGDGMSSTLELGVVMYNPSTGRYEIIDQTDYGGSQIELDIDAGWSIMVLGGMGHELWGQKVNTAGNREFTFHCTVESTETNDSEVVSLYIPFVSPTPVTLSSLIIYDNQLGAAWELPNGTPATGDHAYYWSATEDCDGDGYTDYPDLTFTDYILVSTRNLIQPCPEGNESVWTVDLVFDSSYDISFLCSVGGAEILRGGGTGPTYNTVLPEGVTEQWDVYDPNTETWFTYNNAPMVDMHLTGDQYYTYFNSSAHGNDAYSYPQMYRYAIGYIYGDKIVYIELNDTQYNETIEALLFSQNGPDTSDPARDALNKIYDAITGPGGLVGSIAGYIYDGITWLGDQLAAFGNWIWRGILTLYESIMVAFEEVANVLSYVVEFAVIAVALLVFFGAIVLWNKVLMILRNAIKRATEALSRGLGV